MVTVQGRRLRDRAGLREVEPGAGHGAAAQATEHAVAPHVHRDAVVAELGLRALRATDLAPLFRDAAALVAATLGVDRVAVSRCDPDAADLVPLALVGWERRTDGPVPLHRAPINDMALRSGTPVVVDDLPSDPRFAESVALEQGAVSGAAVVIHRRDRPFGVVTVYHDARRGFGRDDVNFLQAVANVLGAAIERRDAETALHAADERFRRGFEDSRIGMALVDRDGGYLRVNRALCEMLGRTEAELMAMPGFLAVTHPEDVERSVEALARIGSGRLHAHQMEKRYLRPDGSVVWALVSWSAAQDEHGALQYLFTQMQDITERRRAEEELRHLALHDTLTGMSNRTVLLDRLEHALSRARRNGTDVAVLFADLDRFKLVNDSLGHGAGDRLLIALAQRLQSALRPGDTAARFGGDEFVVVGEDVRGAADAVAIARRIEEAFEAPVQLEAREVSMTASVGIALAQAGASTPEALLRDADAAMYRAKERGRGRWEIFDEAIGARTLQRLDTENALRRAVERDELRLLYQPVVSLGDRRIVGAEALLRWERPGHGLLAPAEFVGIAEETDLIRSIGTWVLRTACREAAGWQGAGGRRRPVTVAVNVSPRQLLHADLPAIVADVLDETGLAPSALCLEITEGAVMSEPEAVAVMLRTLTSLGVRLALDDFGTGFSSLGQLRRLPRVDQMKVDRSFVAGLGHTAEDRGIIRAVVALARNVGARVVAEGVEEEGQATELRRLGCDLAQGFAFARPMVAADLRPLLQAGRGGRAGAGVSG